MAKVLLCSCNNCGIIYKDLTPSPGAIETYLPAEIIATIPEAGFDGLGTLCPTCCTSEHISDHWYNVSNWWDQLHSDWLLKKLRRRHEEGQLDKATQIKQALYIFEKL